MKKLFIVLAIAAFASCNDEKTESTTETTAPAPTETVAPPVETVPSTTDAPTTTATSN